MTASYSTGTVSVQAGNAVVTGVGTAWLTSGLVAGQFGLDSANGNPIPVLSIDSDTQITLVKPWRGTNAAGQAYWITYDTRPGQQTVSNAQKLAEYIARLASPFFSAFAGIAPAADKVPFFGLGGVAQLADFNAAARALLAGGVLPNGQLPGRLRPLVEITTNPDLIVESGLYGAFGETPNVPHAGGTWLIQSTVWADPNYAVQLAYNLFNTDSAFRRHKVNAIWQPWRASGQATVGNIARIGSLPTGAIIERGTTSSGHYTRFADGSQECWADLRLAYNSASDLLFDWYFPAQFSATPNIQITESQDWAGGQVRSYVMDSRAASKNPVATLCVSSNPFGNNQAGDFYVVNVLAKGRWF